MSHYTMHFLNAFLLAVVLILLLNRIAGRIGLLDLPQGRKIHSGSIPLTGGLAMFGGFIFPLVDVQLPADVYLGFLLGLSIVVAIGVIDDMLGLGPWTKLAGQVAAALIIFLPAHHVIGFGDLLGQTRDFPQLNLAFTVVFFVGTVNAFNMIDGLDGLAGGAAASALLWLAIVAQLSGRMGVLLCALLLLCAVMGFLVFNVRHPWRREASVFMGDAGSMMLGAGIAYFTIDLSAGPGRAAPLPALLWFCALPAFDTLILIGRRMAAGRNPLSGDRRHLHHLLLEAGISAQAATALLTAICLMLGAVGLCGWLLGLSDRLLLLGLLVPFTLHAFVVLHGWSFIRWTRIALGTPDTAAEPELLGEVGE